MELLIAAVALGIIVLVLAYVFPVIVRRVSRRSYVRGILRNVEIRGRFDSEERSL